MPEKERQSRAKYAKEYYQKNKIKLNEYRRVKKIEDRKNLTPEERVKVNEKEVNYQRKWAAIPGNKEKLNHTKKKMNRERRLRCLSHYSDNDIKCACCGEKNIQFMALDHIGGGGNQHRKTIGNKTIWLWVIQNNFPPIFQVLCHNCNMAEGFYGGCPHKLS